jgi:arsenate reductase (thioredoxin)
MLLVTPATCLSRMTARWRSCEAFVRACNVPVIRFRHHCAVSSEPLNVLFLCTGNSARSILAEQLLNHWGHGVFRAFSAGSHPKGAVHPIALALLENMNLPTAGLRSKSWDELARPDAPRLDFVFTVCDNAAAEMCPVWPGQPLTAHWGVADPAAVEGPETQVWLAFARRSASSRTASRSSRACRSARSIGSSCKNAWTRSVERASTSRVELRATTRQNVVVITA